VTQLVAGFHRKSGHDTLWLKEWLKHTLLSILSYPYIPEVVSSGDKGRDTSVPHCL